MAGTANQATTAIARRETVRAVVAATIGNGIEWFDFISFAYFTPYIAKTFFPTNDPNVSVILTWAGYGLGILVRPIAGAILGVYGDRIGRRRMLSAIILAMALGILIIAVTPGYATIGIAAPILLLLARVLQGVAATGEYSSGIAFLVEHAPPGRKYLFGSFQFVSQFFAAVLSTVAAFVVTKAFAGTGMADWGWRIPFLLGVLVGPIGFYIRLRVAESPEFAALQRRRPEARAVPFARFLRDNRWGVMTAVAITIPGTVATYLWLLYSPAFAIRELHLDPAAVNVVTALCSVGGMILVPIAGTLADRGGPWRAYLPALIALAVTAWPFFDYLVAAPSIGRFALVLALALVLLSFIQGSVAQLAASFFPTQARSSGLGLSVNLGVALFGGLAPLIVTTLIADTGNKLIPAYYIVVAVAVSLVLLIVGRFGAMAQAAAKLQEERV